MPGTTKRGALLVASLGGHLAQLQLLAPALSADDRMWVTFEHANVDVGDDDLIFCHSPTTRNVPNLIRNAVLAAKVLWRNRPDVVVSTGAGVALPFFLLARIIGAQTIFVEVFDRVDSRTLTGRLVKPLSDAFLMQWPAQQDLYGAGELLGPVYDLELADSTSASDQQPAPPVPRVFVSVGTDHHPFDRLVQWCDELAENSVNVFVQHGTSAAPEHASGSPYLSPEEMATHLALADAVVCHGGPSTILEAIAAGHMPIVLPARTIAANTSTITNSALVRCSLSREKSR